MRRMALYTGERYAFSFTFNAESYVTANQVKNRNSPIACQLAHSLQLL